MKKRFWLAAAVLAAGMMVLSGSAWADMSTNLRVETVTGRWNKPITETYVDAGGHPVIASDKGYATVKYSYGTGRVVTGMELLDAEGNLINGVDGYARIENKYSGKKLIERNYYDKDGNLVNGPEGYARQEITGIWGDTTSTWEYDKDGNPVNNHRVQEYIHYGKYKLMVSDCWYDKDGKPVAGPDGYARLENSYVGTVKTRAAYLDEKGSPYYNAKVGYATMLREVRDSLETSMSFYGTDGERIAGPDGYSYVLYSYRMTGHYKRSMWYNADGSLWYNNKGICGIEVLQNYKKQTVEEYYFTGENQRGKNKDGYSGILRSYSKYSQLTGIKYVDENDHLIVVESLGYARVLNTVKDKNRKAREEFFDENNKPTLCAKGYGIATFTYAKGQLIETRYWDIDGKTPINTTGGYARVTYERDENKNIIRTNWYDAEGNPCPGDSGAEEVRNTWNGKYKATESYWTEAGAPALGPDQVNEIRMEYNGKGKVTKKTMWNAAGRMTPGKDGYACVETEYNSEGGVMSVRYYNAAGEMMLAPGKEYAYERTVLTKDLTALARESGNAEEVVEDGAEAEDEEDAEDSADAAEDVEAEEAPADGGMKADSGDAEGSGDGAAEKADASVTGSIVEYYGTDGKLMTLKAGYAYIVRRNNSLGKVAEESYYSEEGEPVAVAAGYAKLTREYDRFGALCREAYFGLEGEKVTLAAGYHYYTRENDNKGNALKTAYFSAGGEPVVNTSVKSHRVDRTYLDAKHILSEAWFDTEGKACAAADTYAKIVRGFDRNGNTTEEWTFDTKGLPICRKDGYDELRRMFDGKNRIIQIQYLTDNRLCNDVNGVAVIQRQYDEAGNVAQEWYLDQDGVAAVHARNKYSRIEREFKDAKHITSEKWFDPWGKPMTVGDTYVEINREFDENGNTVCEKTFGPYHRPIARKAGYDEVRNTFNALNQIIRIEYLLSGKPAAKTDGVAVIEREYDDKGCVTAETYYGAEGEPVLLGGNKYHRIERTWLDSKHATSEAWFDTSRMPMTQGDTFVRIERTFDEKGNTLTEITCDETGKAIKRKNGYDETRWTYNGKNQAEKIEYLLGGAPVVKNDGVATIRREYDDKGCIAVESYYGAEDEPVLLNGKKYHRIERTWLDSKHATSEAWFDTEGQPMAQGETYVKIEREFDEKGNCTEERYYGPDGAAIASKGGWDALRRLFDGNNRASRIFYLLSGEPFTVGDGYAILEREYDDAGNVSAERYYGGDRQRVSHKKGWGEVRKEYNGKKQVIRESWFDLDGKPMTVGNTYCSIEREYDEAGNVNVMRFDDGEGNPIACKDGYEMIWKRFNDKKQCIYESYMDHTGAPMANAKGVYQTTYDYNEKGKITQEQYFDAQGQPMKNADGYVRVLRTYSEDGKLESEHGE